jgi:beta-N-acetylhexosaminidase
MTVKISAEKILFTAAVCLLLQFFFSCSGIKIAVKTEEKTAAPAELPPELPPADPVKEKAKLLLSEMSLEEKAGQLFITGLRLSPEEKGRTAADEAVLKIVNEIKPGGIIFFEENIKTADQTLLLINSLQNASSIPLFIAVDEEGGLISRISGRRLNAPAMPSAQEISESGKAENAFKAGSYIGRLLYSLGFNMNFAPVADVLTAENSRIMAGRTFGSSPEKAAEFASAFMNGLKTEKIISVPKHFPGHGSTDGDTHLGIVYSARSKADILNIDIKPFTACFEAEAIMTAHVIYKNLDSLNSATFSPAIQKDLLRDQLGYKGLIITDSLAMGAISHYTASDKAAVSAFKAGADLLLKPYKITSAWNGIINAVKSGELSMERLDASVLLILETKIRAGLFESQKRPLLKDLLEDQAYRSFNAEVKKR